MGTPHRGVLRRRHRRAPHRQRRNHHPVVHPADESVMTGFDSHRIRDAVTEALSGPGGIALVVTVFSAVPGVVHTPARRGMFRSAPERVEIGDWRYEVAPDGRLGAAHVVGGVVIAEDVLDAGAVGP